MASFSIQFHAVADELSAFVEKWMDDYSICVTAVEYQPFRTARIDKQDLRNALMSPNVRRIMFTEVEPDLSGATNNQTLDKNPGALLLDIGRLGPRGLEESRLSTMDATGVWKKIARSLKRQTTAGVVGVNEQTGASGHYRDHRFTAGAKAIFDKGVIMRPFAQSPVVLRLGE